MGPGCPRENKWDIGANDAIKEPMAVLGHWEKNKRQAQRGLTGLRQTTGMIEWYGKRW